MNKKPCWKKITETLYVKQINAAFLLIINKDLGCQMISKIMRKLQKVYKHNRLSGSEIFDYM